VICGLEGRVWPRHCSPSLWFNIPSYQLCIYQIIWQYEFNPAQKEALSCIPTRLVIVYDGEAVPACDLAALVLHSPSFFGCLCVTEEPCPRGAERMSGGGTPRDQPSNFKDRSYVCSGVLQNAFRGSSALWPARYFPIPRSSGVNPHLAASWPLAELIHVDPVVKVQFPDPLPVDE